MDRSGNLGGEKDCKSKFNFIEKKEITVKSLFEVEHFLRNFNRIFKSVTLYKILK